MAHINPAFVIASSELAIGNGQDHPSSKAKGNQPQDPEGSPPPSKCKEFKNMIRSKWKWSWVFNGVIVLALIAMIVALEFGLIRFRPLGYQCDDPKLSHKYAGDTINLLCVAIICLILPLIAIFIVEFVVNLNVQTYRNSLKKRTLFLALHWCGQFILGVLMLVFLVQLGKVVVGEPRPHFFDSCKPDKINCTGYITKFKCLNTEVSKRRLRDSYRSFPSGHAAMGVFVAIFMSWFFQSRIPYNGYLIVPLLQCIVLSWGIICALTRVTDHRHHWWDVAAGAILGALFAIFTVKVLCRNFRNPSSGRQRKPDKNFREAGSSINNWYKKVFSKSSGTQQDDKELREVK